MQACHNSIHIVAFSRLMHNPRPGPLRVTESPAAPPTILRAHERDPRRRMTWRGHIRRFRGGEIHKVHGDDWGFSFNMQTLCRQYISVISHYTLLLTYRAHHTQTSWQRQAATNQGLQDRLNNPRVHLPHFRSQPCCVDAIDYVAALVPYSKPYSLRAQLKYGGHSYWRKERGRSHDKCSDSHCGFSVLYRFNWRSLFPLTMLAREVPWRFNTLYINTDNPKTRTQTAPFTNS